MFLLICLNLGMGIINIECESYFFAAISFIGVGFVSGVTAAIIIDDM
jgi:hypothetical protein